MDATQVWQAVRDKLATTTILVSDEIITTPTLPYYLVLIGGPTAAARTVGDRGALTSLRVSVMGVNNSAGGCRFLMSRADGLLEGAVLETAGHPVRQSMRPTFPFGDDQAPGDWRWSSTAEYIIHTHRS